MEAVWIAFSCGIFLGIVLGILILGLVDDIHRISWKVKLLAQVSLCLLMPT